MGRVINPERAGVERNRLMKALAVANNRLLRQQEINAETRDLAAFTALCMEAIASTIDPTVEAWEKRGYWLKADRFRLEWDWAAHLGKKMRSAVIGEEWASVAGIAASLAEKLANVKLPKRENTTKPWAGAWDELRKV